MGPLVDGADVRIAEDLRAEEWATVEARNIGSGILDAAQMVGALADPSPCPVNGITALSMRIIEHYQRRQQYAPAGTLLPPGDTHLGSASRMVHGFALVHNEMHRQDKMESATSEGDR